MTRSSQVSSLLLADSPSLMSPTLTSPFESSTTFSRPHATKRPHLPTSTKANDRNKTATHAQKEKEERKRSSQITSETTPAASLFIFPLNNTLSPQHHPYPVPSKTNRPFRGKRKVATQMPESLTYVHPEPGQSDRQLFQSTYKNIWKNERMG